MNYQLKMFLAFNLRLLIKLAIYKFIHIFESITIVIVFYNSFNFIKYRFLYDQLN